MRRREFITLLGGMAASWPLTASGQPNAPLRRIGVLLGQGIDDQQGQARIAALLKALQDMGWTDGRNVQIDVRWGAGNAQEISRYASELVANAPDVIVASGSAAV